MPSVFANIFHYIDATQVSVDTILPLRFKQNCFCLLSKSQLEFATISKISVRFGVNFLSHLWCQASAKLWSSRKRHCYGVSLPSPALIQMWDAAILIFPKTPTPGIRM